MKEGTYIFKPLRVFINSLNINTKIKLVMDINKELIYTAETIEKIMKMPYGFLDKKVVRYGIENDYIVYELVD